MQRKVVKTDSAPKPAGPYSQAIVADNFVFVSGQVGVDPRTNSPVEGIAAQTRQALENLRSILEEAGSSLERIVRVGVFLRDINQFSEMNQVYSSFFSNAPPARTTVQAALPGSFLLH